MLLPLLRLARGLPPRGLHRFRLVNARQARGVEIGHVGAQLGGFHAKPPRQAVIVAGAVNDDKIAPVAARQHIIAGRLKRRPETLPVVGPLPRRLGVGFDGFEVNAGFGGAECLILLRAALGPLMLAVRHKHALAALEVEADLELARRALVNGGGQGIRNRLHLLGVDPRPHHMPVRPPLLLVLDHKARLAGKPEIFLERFNRLVPLRRRQMLVGARVDVGLVEVVFAPRPRRKGFHLAEGVGDGFGAQIVESDNLNALVGLGLLQMLRPPPPGAVAAAVDDDRHGLDAQFGQDRLAQFPVRGVGGFHRALHRHEFGMAAKVVAIHAPQQLVEVVAAPPHSRQHLHPPFGVGAAFAPRAAARLPAKPFVHVVGQAHPGLVGGGEHSGPKSGCASGGEPGRAWIGNRARAKTPPFHASGAAAWLRSCGATARAATGQANGSRAEPSPPLARRVGGHGSGAGAALLLVVSGAKA